MKYISLLLVLNLIFCYTGLSASVCHSGVTQNTASIGCHTTSKDNNKDGKVVNENSYNNAETINQTVSMCHYALPNAPQGHDLNLKGILSLSVVVNTPNPEINNVYKLNFSFENQKDYRLPDLFLLNSTFLI